MKEIFKSIRRKWVYSFTGLWTVLKEEKSVLAQLFATSIVVGLGIWVKLSLVEWAIVVLVIFINIIIEIINTALEAAVDTIMFQYNVKVKKIKDIASGATLVTTAGSIIVILIIFIPAIQGVL